jgi:hypothetical protein
MSYINIFNPPIKGHEDPSTSIYSTMSYIKIFNPPIKGHEVPSTSIQSIITC